MTPVRSLGIGDRQLYINGESLEVCALVYQLSGRHRHEMEARADLDTSCAVMNNHQTVTLLTGFFLSSLQSKKTLNVAST